MIIGTWRGVDATRRFIFNLVFVVIVIALLVLLFKSDKPDVPKTAALVIAPQGVLVEQLTAQSARRMVDEARGAVQKETLLKDVIDAVDAAKDDERIEVLVLELSDFAGGRQTKLEDLRDAIVEFKESGKQVIATADGYAQGAYYLAAHADKVLMHEMGALVFESFGRYRMYFKDGIDRLGLDVHIFRVGTYKSAVEPFLRNDMSPEAREANLEWMGDLWNHYLDAIVQARGISRESLEVYVNELPRLLVEAGGDTAKIALDAGLVDETLSRDEVRDMLIELVGEDEDDHTYYQVAYQDYLEALDEDRFGRDAKGDRVGVVVARGTILDGSHPAGTIGGDSTAALIRQARNNEDVKAIVLRVDSGGGSAFASEIIRKECELARDEGKPVVVSMGSVAASGGFWISTSSDQIWAHPTTITGSIGIFGMFPTYQRPLAQHLGIRVDGVGTGALAGIRPDRAMPEEVAQAFQAAIDNGYHEFLERVAAARGMTTDEVNLVAQGRVWSGEDAYDAGLVDELGGLNEAIAAAAEFAELGEDYAVTYIEKEKEFKEEIAEMFLAQALKIAGPEFVADAQSPLAAFVRQLEDEAGAILELNDPAGIYADSMITTD
jgi:protease-4